MGGGVKWTVYQDKLSQGQFIWTNCYKDSLSGQIEKGQIRNSCYKDRSGRIITRTNQDELLQGQIVRTNCFEDSLSGRIVTRTVYQDELPQGQVIRKNCHKDSLSRRDEYINVKF